MIFWQLKKMLQIKLFQFCWITTLFSSAVVLILGLWVDSYPCWKKWQRAKYENYRLKELLSKEIPLLTNRNVINPMHVKKEEDQIFLIHELDILSRQTDVKIQSLKILSMHHFKNIHMIPVHFIVRGGAISILKYMNDLISRFSDSQIMQWKLTVQSNADLLMDALVFFVPNFYEYEKQKRSDQFINYPFCFSSQPQALKMLPSKDALFSELTPEETGWVRLGNKLCRLHRLSNGSVRCY